MNIYEIQISNFETPNRKIRKEGNLIEILKELDEFELDSIITIDLIDYKIK